MTKKNYTKYSESSKDNDKEQLIEEPTVEPEVQNSIIEIKSLTDCTREELLEVAAKENVIFTEEATNEEIIEAIEVNRNTEALEEDINNIEPKFETFTVTAEGNVNNIEAQNTTTVVITPEEPEVDEDHTGDICPAKVMGCTKLNVREEPSKDSKVVCVITEESDLTVSNDLSTEDFYKVYINVNDILYEGYCMKKFIQID